MAQAMTLDQWGTKGVPQMIADVTIDAFKKGQPLDFQAFRVTIDGEAAKLLPRLSDGGQTPYENLTLDITQKDTRDNTIPCRVVATLCGEHARAGGWASGGEGECCRAARGGESGA